MDIKDMILRDALGTAIEDEKKIIQMRRIIAIEGIAIAILLILACI